MIAVPNCDDSSTNILDDFEGAYMNMRARSRISEAGF